MLTQEIHPCPALLPSGRCMENSTAVTSATPPWPASLTDDDTTVVRNCNVRPRSRPAPLEDAEAIDTAPVTTSSAARTPTIRRQRQLARSDWARPPARGPGVHMSDLPDHGGGRFRQWLGTAQRRPRKGCVCKRPRLPTAEACAHWRPKSTNSYKPVELGRPNLTRRRRRHCRWGCRRSADTRRSRRPADSPRGWG